jgi:hypothetical protein
MNTARVALLELSSVPIQRGATLADCDRLQREQPVAAVGVAAEDRQLVADQLAVGENGRPAAETRPLLLVAAGESHLTRRLVGAMLRRMSGLASASGIGVESEQRPTAGRRFCQPARLWSVTVAGFAS